MHMLVLYIVIVPFVTEILLNSFMMEADII